LLAEFFPAMRRAIELHGGTVEKYIGDAILAVFGVPTAHEDDALRAVRAAVGMQAELARLNDTFFSRFGVRVGARIGINTGEVLAGTSSAALIAAGDPVNVAARLEQAADAGDVVIGAATYRLVRHDVIVEALPPLVAKGKAQPLASYRVIGFTAISSRVPQLGRYVGRKAEVATLRSALERATAQRQPVRVTIVGEAGLGKSRLAREFASLVEETADVHVGRCLSYGEGITFWPVVEIIRSALGLSVDSSREDACARIEAIVDGATAERIEELLGLDDRVAPLPASHAIRTLLQRVLGAKPSVIVFEDIQWAEETLLDLVDALVRTLTAPLLVICTARPEFLARRTEWPEIVELSPLSSPEIEELVASALVGPDVVARTIRLANGNPLFAEELAVFMRERFDEQNVPSRLSALLTARLDTLADADRLVAERASIEGEVFHLGGLQMLTGEPVADALERLTQSGLVLPAQPTVPGEAAYRFKHILVREAAYAGISKRIRADLHERFADWIEQRAGVGPELDQIAGFHLEQAYRLRVEVAPVNEYALFLARRAFEHLATAGKRARAAADMSACRNLLMRATQLPDQGEPDRFEASLVLATAWAFTGESALALALLDAVVEQARTAGDERALARALVSRTEVRGVFAGDSSDAEEAIRLFDRLHDYAGLAVARCALASYFQTRDDFERAWPLNVQAVRDAERDRDAPNWLLPYPVYEWALHALIGCMMSGPTPWPEIRKLAREAADRAWREGKLGPAAGFSANLSFAEAALGNIVEARTANEMRQAAVSHELAIPAALPAMLLSTGDIELAAGEAGDLGRAYGAYRRAYELSRDGHADWPGIDDGWNRVALAGVLVRMGRDEEAQTLVHEDSSFSEANIELTLVRAELDGRAGRTEEGERAIRGVLEWLDGRQYIQREAIAHERLGDILAKAGREDEAMSEWRLALELYDRKGSYGRRDALARRTAERGPTLTAT
jgi:tetratricopeptide (TPR) repeat protein